MIDSIQPADIVIVDEAAVCFSARGMKKWCPGTPANTASILRAVMLAPPGPGYIAEAADRAIFNRQRRLRRNEYFHVPQKWEATVSSGGLARLLLETGLATGKSGWTRPTYQDPDLAAAVLLAHLLG